jgi:hypothetical protein
MKASLPECIIISDFVCSADEIGECYLVNKKVKARSDHFGLSIRASQIPGSPKD